MTTEDLKAAHTLAQQVLDIDEGLTKVPDAQWNGEVLLEGEAWAAIVDLARSVRFQRNAKVP